VLTQSGTGFTYLSDPNLKNPTNS